MNYWKQQAEGIAEWLREIRRHIHQNPELGYKEVETASYIAEILRAEGIDVREGVGGTGIVATIRGIQPGKTIALRADMDALPIKDKTGMPYSSQIPGLSHACGHDAHCAILAGTAKLLYRYRRRLTGTVKCIWQPAEECPPTGGAQLMIADGVLEQPTVDAIYALHVAADLPVGSIGIARGPAMAASDRAQIQIVGAGGHGSAPHQTVDAVLVAAHTVVALQSIVARNVNPARPAVLSVGVIEAGCRYNAIAEKALLDCTVRTVDVATRQLMQERIEQVVAGVTQSMGADYRFRYTLGFPAASNTDAQVEQVVVAAEKVMGPQAVNLLETPSLSGEDFAFFLEKVPGAFFWIGSRLDDGRIQYPAHHPGFDINEDVLPLGVALFCQIVEQELGG